MKLRNCILITPSACRDRSRAVAAFTLVELLVVIAIIGILVSLMFPALGGARDRARTLQCAVQMRQIGMLVTAFANERRGFLPAMSGRNPVKGHLSENPNGYDLQVELQLMVQGKGNLGYVGGFSPWGHASKTPEWLCAAMGPKARADGDMRRVAYGPNKYAWDAMVMMRYPEYRTQNLELIDGYPVHGRMARYGTVPTNRGQGPAEIIMFGERLPFMGVPWIIGQNDPTARDVESGTHTDGRLGLKWFMEPRHGAPRDGFVGRGMNFLYFDGHVALDADYFENYSSDLASLMWGYFRWP